MKLNVGCGKDIKQGWINCDFKQGPGVDRVFDVSQVPIPFEDDSVDEILVCHVLEHIQNWEEVVMEFHRVLKPGGVLTVRVPYGVTFTPYHVRFFMPETFDAFIEPQPYERCCQLTFKSPLFKLEKKEVWRAIPFGWHLDHYLKLKFLYGEHCTFPLGKKTEIYWELIKIDGKAIE